jgi:transposase InsO family protein
MSRARVAVLQVVAGQLSVTESAAKHGFSRRHLHRLLAAHREGGLDALEPRLRRPITNPARMSEALRGRVIALRQELTADGLDPGPVTIAWHLEREGLRAPSTSTIRRILHQAGLITPEPRKRPRSSYIRFQASQPNEMWQSDFIHWRLADGTDVEILNWLDDHSRYLLSCTAHEPVTGDDVVAAFLDLVERYGPPASTLTDNGTVYTSRITGGRNAFEYVLALLGVRQKNGAPGHPQTQGKTERFHQTLQRWLAARLPARSTTELERQLDAFRAHYNERRPHRALGRNTPANAYRATPKAVPRRLPPRRPLPPALRPPRHQRQDDHPPRRPHAPPRHRHHPRPQTRPRARRRTPHHVADLTTGEVLSTHQIEPDKTYWRNQNENPADGGAPNK